MNQIYDVIIIGAGPAGLTASIYCSCFHLNHVVVGKILGGQMILAPDILNYPGFAEISGVALTSQMAEQAKRRGGGIIEDLVIAITRSEDAFVVKTEKRDMYKGKSIILATGMERLKLNVLGEMQYASRGVHYWATCERQYYKGKRVAVVGGGNSAVQSALQLAQAALHVHILCRSSELSCHAIWAEQIGAHANIEIRYDTKVTEILGDGEKVTGVKIVSDNKEQTLPVEKVFIEIGGMPGTALVVPLGVAMDSGGFIHVDATLATNIPGIFAAGDLVSYGLSIEQISTAVGLGARAAASTFSYLKKQKAPTSWGQALIRR